MIPDASSDIIKKEKHSSPTRNLAATLAFKLLRKFGQGTTQRNMQELFDIRPKQLALCIMGRKYLGGTDRRARKQKSIGRRAINKCTTVTSHLTEILSTMFNNHVHLADKKSARRVVGNSNCQRGHPPLTTSHLVPLSRNLIFIHHLYYCLLFFVLLFVTSSSTSQHTSTGDNKTGFKSLSTPE